MRLAYLLALLSVYLALPLDAYGGLGTGGCAPVGRVSEWQWKYGQYQGHLYRNGQYVGTWDYPTKRWHPVISGTPAPFKMPCDCGCDICDGDCRCSAGAPCSDSCTCVASVQQASVKKQPNCPCTEECDKCDCKDGKPCEKNFGINLSAMTTQQKGKTVYRFRGAEVPKELAYERVEKGLPNDDGKLWLTAIGTDRQKVIDDFQSKAFDGLRDRLIIKEFPADHWAVKDMGYVVSGKPTIYLQAPDGKVLHRQDDYQDGPEGLAEAIRKANDKYNPKADPDLRKTVQLPNIPIVPLVVILAAGCAFFFFGKRA